MIDKSPLSEILYIALALVISGAIIYGAHYIVGGSDPEQNTQHMIPWLEVLLAGTVCSAFIKDEVLDIATFFRVGDRKRGGFSKGNVAVLCVVIWVSSLIFYLLESK
jgi:hypothetical protein